MNRLATLLGAALCVVLVVEILAPGLWKRIGRSVWPGRRDDAGP